jgi:phage terminase large subunit-like protein
MTPSPALDPVTHYATEVVALRIIAGRLVRLACARHLDDLARQAEKGLVWKPADAQEVIDFFPSVLCLPEETDVDEDVEALPDVAPATGTPFVLSPYQQFIAGSLCGWWAILTSKKTGVQRIQQRFRIAYIEGAKGCGKTPLGAGLLIFLLVRHGVRGAQLFCAAVTKDQAKIAFADCEKMVAASPLLKALITQVGLNLAVKSTGSFIRPISAEKRGLDGKRVQGALIDELHEHPTSIVVDKLRAGTKGRPNALILEVTNSGYDRESVCWYHHEYSRDVLEGRIVNEAWFAYVCQLDPCEKHVAAGKRAPVEGCPACDQWQVEGPHWLKTNPNLGVSLPWQYLREQVLEAIGMPSKRNIVMRLNFCCWTDQITVWIATEKWAACAGPATGDSLRGQRCFVGIDVSSKLDLTAVELLFPREEELPAIVVDLGPDWQGETPHERPKTRRTFNLHRQYDLVSHFWTPADTLAAREAEDHVPYAQWVREGHLHTTTGSMIDQDEILEFVLSTLATSYTFLGIGIDISNAAAMVTRLQRQFGKEKVIDIPQGFRSLSEPSKIFEALVVAERIHHDHNRVMNQCVAHVGIEPSKWGDIRPVKLQQRKRIDGVVAVIDAIRVSTLVPDARSVYATRGALVVKGEAETPHAA